MDFLDTLVEKDLRLKNLIFDESILNQQKLVDWYSAKDESIEILIEEEKIFALGPESEAVELAKTLSTEIVSNEYNYKYYKFFSLGKPKEKQVKIFKKIC